MKKGKEKQKMRRLTALFLSLMLICAMSMTAFAAQTDTIGDVTQNNADVNVAGDGTDADGSGNVEKVEYSEHSYVAYQIFKGDYYKDPADPAAKAQLSNIQWGTGAPEETGIRDVILKELGCATLPDILTKLGTVGDETTVANQLAAAIASNATLLGPGQSVKNGDPVESGYYIVIDTTDGDAIKDGDARNFALLQCIKNIQIIEKTGTVTSEKKVEDKNDSDADDPSNGVLGTSADYDIGDNVPFVLRGTVAKNFAQFQGGYKFVFHDTLSAGLSFNEDISVTMDGKTVDASHYNVVYPVDGETFKVEFLNVEKIPNVQVGSVIEISYTAKLLDNATIGSPGNTNEMYLEYSNNTSGDGTGKTPGNKVIVFTYQVDINKVDGNGVSLAGAEFALYKADPSYAGQDSPFDKADPNYKYNKKAGIYKIDDTGTEFSFKGIDDGEYLLVETKTPDGYNSIEPIAFEVKAGHTLNADGTVTLDLSDAVDQLTLGTASGTLTTDVINQSGSLLPSTGGIGTTMFYIIGGILMVGACMMLFVRKIMTNEKR